MSLTNYSETRGKIKIKIYLLISQTLANLSLKILQFYTIYAQRNWVVDP